MTKNINLCKLPMVNVNTRVNTHYNGDIFAELCLKGK